MEIQDGSAKFIVRDKRMQALVDMFYPVGSVYATVSDTKPEFMNYGTWEEFAQGRTLVGAGTGTDANGTKMTFTNGGTGGEYTHQLTVGEMPAHSHTLANKGKVFSMEGTTSETTAGFATGGAFTDAAKARTSLANTGGNGTHNNIQPYVTVHYYKRIS